MYWGCEISNANDFTLPKDEAANMEEDEGKMLHVSNVSLNTGKKTTPGSKFKVFCKVGENRFLVANLTEGSVENYALDLYFKEDEGCTFSISGKGNASAHLTGYWEASPNLMDDEYGMGPMEMDMGEDDEDDMDTMNEAKANAMRNALISMGNDVEDSESDEDDVAQTTLINQQISKVTELPDSDDSEDIMPAAAPVAEESDESDEAPALVPAKSGKKNKKPVFEDSDEDSDEFDVKAILANKKRKAEADNSVVKEQKRQKINEHKEKIKAKKLKKAQLSGSDGESPAKNVVSPAKSAESPAKQHNQNDKKRNKKNKNKNKGKGKH
jgi:hypothetical protein